MNILLYLVSCGIVIFVHEYGHWAAMQEYGIRAKKFVVGLPIPYLTLKIPSCAFIGGTPLWISPIFLCGFVEPKSTLEIRRLSEAQRLHIFGAGIINNLFIVCICALGLLKSSILGETSIITCIFLLLFFERQICRYCLPMVTVIVLLAVPLLAIPTDNFTDGIHLQVTIDQMPTGMIGKLLLACAEMSIIAGVISLSMAFLNLLPFVPLDGGKIALVYLSRWLSRKAIRVVQMASLAIVATMIIMSWSMSAYSIFGRIRHLFTG